MKAIVTGMIATYPVGGVAWDYGQYALGLEAYHPVKRDYGADSAHGVDFLRHSLAALSPGLGKRWQVRSVDGTTHGMPLDQLRDVIAEADLFLNVSGSALMRDEYLHCRNKVLIDTDPGLSQLRNYPRWDARPRWMGTHGFRAHDHFSPYAELIGTPACMLPTLGLQWQPTRPPVVLDLWRPQPPGQQWTTVMTWRNFPELIEYQGRRYGGKELEFGSVEALPGRTAANLEIAVGGVGPPIARWRSLGWSVIDSHSVSATMDDYRGYIERSRGEFSVAKNTYAATCSGWFSCRTVCYLAAGRPAVLQDTGYSRIIPCGEGVLPFRSLDEAAAAIESVEARYAQHQEAARSLAERYFASDRVLGDLLERIGIG